MAKRTSLAKQLGLSDDPVQPQSFSREAFKLSPVPVRGGGWSTAVAATPTPSQTNLGRLSGALSQVSGLLAQAKAFEDKKLEMEHKGLQIDHQTALSQLQGQAMDARIGELATKMDMAEQMTAEAAEANYWASMSFEERERAEREQAEFVDEIGKIRTDAQNEMFKQEAQTPEAKKDPVVKNERRELYRGAQVARDFPAALTEALQEWYEGSGEEGVQFRPSEEDYNAFVIQFTERYKGEHNIELGSTADRAFNVGTRRVFETVVPTEKVKLFAALEGEVLIDDIKQAEQTLGDILSAGGSVLDEAALEAPWWNTLKGRSLKQKDAFFKLYVDNLLAQSEANPAALETAKFLLRLPDKDPEFKYRSDAPFSESSLYLTQLNRILLAEEQQEEKRIAKDGKKASRLTNQLAPFIAWSARGLSVDENSSRAISALQQASAPTSALFRSVFPTELTEQNKVLLEEIEAAPEYIRSEVAQFIANNYATFANNKEGTYEALLKRLTPQNQPEYGLLPKDGGRYTGSDIARVIREAGIELSRQAAESLGDFGGKDGPYGEGDVPDEVKAKQFSDKRLREEVYGPALANRKAASRNAVENYLNEYESEHGTTPDMEQAAKDLMPILSEIYGDRMLADIARYTEESLERQREIEEIRAASVEKGTLEGLRNEHRSVVRPEEEFGANEGAIPWWERQDIYPSTMENEPSLGALLKSFNDKAIKRVKEGADVTPTQKAEEADVFLDSLSKGRERYETLEREARRGIIDLYKTGYGAVTNSPPQMGRENFPAMKEFYPFYFKQQRAWEQKMAHGVNIEDLKGYMSTSIVNNKSTGHVVIDTQESYWNEAADELYSERGKRPEKHPSDWKYKGTWIGTPTKGIRLPEDIRERTTRQTAPYLYMDNGVGLNKLKILRPPIVNLPQNVVKRDADGSIKSVNESAFIKATNLKPEGLKQLTNYYGFETPKEFIMYQYDHPIARSQVLTGKKLDFK